MRDSKKDRPHQPRAQPQNLEKGGFQQSYPSEGSYNHQPQQHTNSVPGYQYSCPSKIANSLEESSAVEGYPPNQHRCSDSYYQPQPLQHQSAVTLPPRSGSSHQHNLLPPQSAAPISPRFASSHQHNSLSLQPAAPLPPQSGSSHQHNSLPPQSGSSYQHNAHPPQSYAPLSSIHAASVQGYSPFRVPPPESNPLTQRYRSSNNYQAGQPSVPSSTSPAQGHVRLVEANSQARNRASEERTTHYNEQQPPVYGNYPPSAPSTDWDDEYESTPIAYPTHDYQHKHAPVALTAPTAHPIHTSLVNHEQVQPVPNVYGAPHTQPSQEPMVQPQPSFPPSTPPQIRQSAVTSDSQVPPTKPVQQPSIVSTLSDATKPPDGYPTVGQHQPSPGPQSSRCCCTIL